ncbi:putative membrane protein [Desmospora profundinema]|uniref:Membrane protein n=1 Tax=Desmospora profundinema TaxID=1571184 RepID=A0ABU1INC0_9BACL|nr:putative membrane protein [Desmospora profundinema]
MKILEFIVNTLLALGCLLAFAYGGVFFLYWSIVIVVFVCFHIYKNWDSRRHRYLYFSLLIFTLLWFDILYGGPLSQLLNI